MSTITIISNYYPPEIGAASSRIYNMAKSFKNNGYDVNILCPMPNYPKGKVLDGYRSKLFKKDLIEGISIYRFFIYPSNSKNKIKRMLSMISFAVSIWFIIFNRKLIKSSNLVIIQNSPLLVSFSSVILFKTLLHRKVILNVSDLWPKSAVDIGLIKQGLMLNLLQNIEFFNYSKCDKILCQSKEIEDFILRKINKDTFIYRNIQPNLLERKVIKEESNNVRLVYAGLLGVAQGVCNLIQQINFEGKKITLDIYGDGNEKSLIIEYLKNNHINSIKYKGSLSKQELTLKMTNYDFALVPLVKYIEGAFPSKIYELIQLEIPIIYIGEGEAFDFVTSNNLGYAIKPGNTKQIQKTLYNLGEIPQTKIDEFSDSCKLLNQESLDFNIQFKQLLTFIQAK